MITFDLERDDRWEEEQLERAYERNTRRTGCQCGTDLPGTCPGPANCPMCQPDADGEE